MSSLPAEIAEGLYLALAGRLYDRPIGRDVVAWAQQALADEVRSRSLRELAGLSGDDDYEVEAFLHAACDELATAVPTDAQLARGCARLLARDLVERRIGIEAGVGLLVDFTVRVGTPAWLAAWPALATEVEHALDRTSGRTLDEVTSEVLAAARALASAHDDALRD